MSLTSSTLIFCAALLVVCALAVDLPEPLAETYDFEVFPTGSYKLHTEKLHWGDAWQVCRNEGAYLAIINDDTEAFIMSGLFARVPDSTSKFCSVGFHDMFVEGHYVTIEGQELADTGYSTWATGEPNNSFNEDCGAIEHDGRFNDIDCTTKYVFICEKIADPAV